MLDRIGILENLVARFFRPSMSSVTQYDVRRFSLAPAVFGRIVDVRTQKFLSRTLHHID